MTTTGRNRGGLSLWSQMARVRKSVRFILVILAILLLLGMGAPRRAEAQVESVIHNFAGGDGGGYYPYAGLVRDSAGNLYGTTANGGSGGGGTVFEFGYNSASNSYTEIVLHNFTGYKSTDPAMSDGASPQADLIMDSSGNLYGTTANGGSSNDGTVFQLVYNSSTNSYTEAVLRNFKGGPNDGAGPVAGVIRDSAGNLYGTTFFGGSSTNCVNGCGTVFELVYDSASDAYTENVLYNFSGGGDGYSLYAGLFRDSSGNLYGTTANGGSSTNCINGCGIVFELVYDSTTNSYTQQVLHNFSSGSDGAYPHAGLVGDPAGNLYGTTYLGYGTGNVFELTQDPSSSTGYSEQVIYNFTGGEGGSPTAGLLRDSSGNLYGTTNGGNGNVFELLYDSTTDSYTEGVLHTFTGGPNDGADPLAGVIMDSWGNLYGTTEMGGAWNAGTLYGIAPVTLSSTSLDFGTVEEGSTSGSQTVTLTNIGQAGLSYGAASISGANAADFAITTDGCGGTTVAPTSTCSVSITFTPSTGSSESASLSLTENGLAQTVALTGTGALPTANLSATSLTFQAQPVGASSSAQTVTVTNTSAFTLNITSVGITGDFAIDSNTCGASVAAGQNCTVGITFSPTAGGTRTGTLSLTDNAASSPQTVALSGDGEDFSIGAQTPSATISAGGTASYDLQLLPEGGFSGDVSLTCSDTVSKSACSLSPASVTLNGTGSSTVTLKVTTAAASGMVPPVLAPWHLPPMVVFWIGLFVLLGMGVLVRFRPARIRIRPALLASLAVVLLAITFWTACGSGASPGSGGTPPGTYTLTVKGASGSLSHSTPVLLTVR